MAKNTIRSVMEKPAPPAGSPTRREALKLLLAGLGLAAFSPLTSACGESPQQPVHHSSPYPRLEVAKTVDVILNYPGMANVKAAIDNCPGARDALIEILGSYNPLLPTEKLKKSAFRVFDGPQFGHIKSYAQAYGVSQQEEEQPGFDYTFFMEAKMKHFEATREFIVNIAHVIFIESNHLVPWSIKDYTPEITESLLLTQPSIHNTMPYPNMTFLRNGTEETDPYMVFKVARQLLPSKKIEDQSIDAQLQAVQSILQWVPLNFFHPYEAGDENWDQNDVYPFTDFVDGAMSTSWLPIEALFRERLLFGGCLGAALVASTMARSLGIPAIPLLRDETVDGIEYRHWVISFPSLKLFAHGDWFAMQPGRRGDIMLYPYDSFVNDVIFMDQASTAGKIHFGDIPGTPSCLYHAGLRRTATTRELYLDSQPFLIKPDSYSAYLPLAFEGGDMAKPTPDFKAMLDILAPFSPTTEKSADPNYPDFAYIASGRVPILTLQELTAGYVRQRNDSK